MKLPGKLGVTAAVALILVVGLLLQAHRPANSEGKGPHLQRVIPEAMPGWRSHSLKLGTTEVPRGEVEKVLQFDDVFFREYQGPNGAAFSVYAAYWRSGKVPAELISAHTPDICWIGNGWAFGPGVSGSIGLKMADGPTLQVQQRLFLAPGGTAQYVWFWHCIGGETLDDSQARSWQTLVVWRNLWRRATAPGEQYFVRVSSGVPFERLAGDPGWERMLGILTKLDRPESGVGAADSKH